ncbi:MAG: DUF1015 domain-containing protein [Thermoplasmatales archaeon]|nr:MAG: DUF1015 domain-containing protein [Thermoplasmatales archaeon]
MVEISPFKGITYNKEKTGKLDKVMSPPYDIISEKMQSELYEKHPYNFVKLILGKQSPDDTEKNNRYTRARKLFDEWQKQSVLLESDKSAIYPYKIEYKINNEKKTMNGFFVLLKLDPDYKMVKAHERTLSKPKADRLNLMRACHANLEPIQLLYIDEDDNIRKKVDGALDNPIIEVNGYDGFTHKLWKLDNEDIISIITNKLKDEILFIADGHHRYQTAINYANELKEEMDNNGDTASFNYRMVILANMFDKGLSILPTHRLLKMPGFNLKELIERLSEFFNIEEKGIGNKGKDYDEIGKNVMKDIETKSGHKFALYWKNKYYVLTLKDEGVMDELAHDRSSTWRTLDVSILHKIILEKLFGVNEKNLEDHVKYTRVDGEAIQFVEEGKFDFSFFMNATKIEELKAIADAGEHMPQKSTYFLPKMLSGLVMYKM